jgi:hypothetical protein
MHLVDKYRELGSYRAGRPCVRGGPHDRQGGGRPVLRAARSRSRAGPCCGRATTTWGVVRRRVEQTQGSDQRQAAAAGRPRGRLPGVGPQLPSAGRRGEGRLPPVRADLPAVAARAGTEIFGNAVAVAAMIDRARPPRRGPSANATATGCPPPAEMS